MGQEFSVFCLLLSLFILHLLHRLSIPSVSGYSCTPAVRVGPFKYNSNKFNTFLPRIIRSPQSSATTSIPGKRIESNRIKSTVWIETRYKASPRCERTFVAYAIGKSISSSRAGGTNVPSAPVSINAISFPVGDSPGIAMLAGNTGATGVIIAIGCRFH